MALEYSLELESDSPEWSLVIAALHDANARDIEFVGAIPMSGFFDRSGTYFRMVDCGHLKEVSAEDFPKDLFLTSHGLVFRVNVGDLEQSAQDIHDFLLSLASKSTLRFVLSHQYEEVHAYRTDKFVWNW